ncbi:hypothetical protein C8256_14075 [Kluyvera genomosp. 2]|uniref:Uncharacterized protein n=1 Tax=Kluyvera genomosp. 2 TaxID=2774054 RepID=A0A2T2Y0T1_9ENTR|nr:hypothetical protein C8256_14075 [Kluyvera genomosp. 2]
MHSAGQAPRESVSLLTQCKQILAPIQALLYNLATFFSFYKVTIVADEIQNAKNSYFSEK